MRRHRMIKWYGGPCPLCPMEVVTVQMKNGNVVTGLARDFHWKWTHGQRGLGQISPSLNVLSYTPHNTCQKPLPNARPDWDEARPVGGLQQKNGFPWWQLFLFVSSVLLMVFSAIR